MPDKPHMSDQSRLRSVHTVEVMETAEHDRVFKIFGFPGDARKEAAAWRAKDRKVSLKMETVLWS